jgi:hypothetical protein
MTDEEIRQFYASRKAEGLKIDPATAEVFWWYRQEIDPYGILDPFPEEYDCVGRAYFARNPGSDIWVCFCDLPDATAEALSSRRLPSLSVG